MPILRGRSFTRQDAEQPKTAVVVVNEALAKADTHQMGLDTEVRPELFLPTRTLSSIALVVRTADDPLRLSNAVESQVWAIDSNQPVADVYSMEQRMGEGLAQRRFNMLLFGIFAGLALLLASVGIYGVLAYTVSQRMREIGIRIALGASARNVAGLVLRQGLLLALVGVLIGGGAAFALTRWMESLIFGVSPTDPVTFSAVSTLLVAIALAASYVPARRAVKVDPMRSLRVQ